MMGLKKTVELGVVAKHKPSGAGTWLKKQGQLDLVFKITQPFFLNPSHAHPGSKNKTTSTPVPHYL